MFKSGWPCHNKFEDLPPEFLKTEHREREEDWNALQRKKGHDFEFRALQTF